MPTLVSPLSSAKKAHPKLDPRLAALVELDDFVFAPVDPPPPPATPPSEGRDFTPERARRKVERRTGPLAFLTGPRPREGKSEREERLESASFSFVPVFITAANADALDRIALEVGFFQWQSRAGRIGTAQVNLAQLYLLEEDDEVEAVEWTGGAKPLGLRELRRGISPRAAVGLDATDAELDGSGVVVGIVDIEGLDIYHPDFTNERGMLRVRHLWDQTASRVEGELGSRPKGYGYGVEYDRAELWAELDPSSRERYAKVAHEPLKISHGTMVAGIAAGGGMADPEARGVAPAADIVFVSTRASGAGAFAAMTEIAEAVHYVCSKAGDHPCVINVSLGDDLGPRDGTSPVERFFDEVCAERPGLAIVVAAGNSNERECHVSGLCSEEGGPVTVVCAAAEPSARHAVIEIWYDAVADDEEGISMELSSPGEALQTPRIVADGKPQAFDLGEARVLVASVKRYPSGSGAEERDNALLRVEVFPRTLGGTLPAGDYSIRLFGDGKRRAFHAWLDHTSFKLRASPAGGDAPPSITLTSPSTSRSVIAVAACSHETSHMGSFVGAGPGRHAVDKPDVMACGVRLRAPSAVTSELYYPAFTGTSAAAPLVTGAVALLFQRALQRGARLSVPETMRLVRAASGGRPPTAYQRTAAAGGESPGAPGEGAAGGRSPDAASEGAAGGRSPDAASEGAQASMAEGAPPRRDPPRLWLHPKADLADLFARAGVASSPEMNKKYSDSTTTTTSVEAGTDTRKKERQMNTEDVRGAQKDKDHVRERDGQQLGVGLYTLFQAELEVGRVLVVEEGSDMVEHWDLGTGFRQPSWANRDVGLQFIYMAESMDLTKFRATIGGRSTYIVARCTQMKPDGTTALAGPTASPSR